MGSKWDRFLVGFFFLDTTYHIPEWIWFSLFSLSSFYGQNPFDGQLGYFELGNFFKELIKCYNLCIIKGTALSKKHLYDCFCEWRSGIKLSKVLAMLKRHKKTFLLKQLYERFFHFILIFPGTNSKFRTQTL